MSGSRTPDPPEGPGGLVVMIRTDPVAAARGVAKELEADLVVGGEAAEVAVAAAVKRASRPRADLDALGAAAARADAVRARTRRGIADRLARSLNTDLAIHPESLHRAAAELLAARERRVRAERIHWWARRRGEHEREVAEAERDAAQRRWERLVGPGIEPESVEEIVHRYDPQADVVSNLLGHHPAVRAVDSVALERHLALDRAHAERRAEEAGSSTRPGPLVVAQPYAGLDEERSRALHRRLLALPVGLHIVVVLSPGPSTADDRVLDLTDPAGDVLVAPIAGPSPTDEA